MLKSGTSVRLVTVPREEISVCVDLHFRLSCKQTMKARILNDRRRICHAAGRCAVSVATLALLSVPACADDFRAELEPFIQSSCIACHDADTETRLDVSSLGHDLTDDETFRTWVRIFDRVRRGEMPPQDSTHPSDSDKRQTLSVLKKK